MDPYRRYLGRAGHDYRLIFSTAREHSPSDTSRERTRCNANRSICAGVLIVTKVMVGRCTASAIGTALSASLLTVCRANENNKGDTNGGRSRRSDLRVPQMPRDGYASFQRRIGRRRRLLNRHP